MIPRIRRILAALLALAGLSASVPALAQDPVVIRGTVADSTGAPVPSATVRITRHPQNDGLSTQTGPAGTFTLTFPPGGTEYYVLVSGPGWKPFRARIAPDPAHPAWARLSVRLLPADPVVLAPVTVRAVRAPPGRDVAMGPGVGAAEAPVEGVAATLAPAEAGELAAMAATVPGVLRAGEGISVLGLDPSQNRATLNGMEFAGSSLPRDLAARTRVATSAYDPARGGFSGAEVAVEVAPGSAFTLGRASVSGGASPFGDAGRPGSEGSDFRASIGRDGEISPERVYYTAGAQVNRRSRDASSIENASADALAGAGVSPTAAAEFERALSSLGIPPGVAGGIAATDELVLMARVDHTPFGPRSWGASAYANAGRSDAVPGVTSTAASASRSRWATLAAQGEHSRLIGRFHRNDTRTSLSVATRAVEPLFALPGGRVEVAGDVPGSVASLGFGGGAADMRGRRWSWQTTNETRWNDSENRHQRKVYLESLLEGFDNADATGTRGAYTFRSLDDLAAGRGATYSRRLGSTRASGVQWNGALALGDSWRVSPRLRVMGGVRLDANRFLSAPGENPGVQETFGVRTGHVPGGWGLSPRLGFNWSPRGRLPTPGIRFSPLGSRGETPVGLVRGGVGVFRGRHAVEALSGPLLATGLSGLPDEIRCVGPAVPAPDWTGAGASLASRCADGGGAFGDSTPRVEVFAPGFSPPQSVRGNLAWSSRAGWLGYTVEALYSLNLDQPGTVDLNFAGVPRFTLSSEAGRPVYVAPSAIDPVTGFAAPGEARRDPAYGPVLARRSDLRSESRQLTVLLAPELPDRYWLGLGYTLAGSRAQFRSFDGAALGDPSATAWAPGRFDARHQLHLQAGWTRSWLSVGFYARFFSGLPFTPVVAGDVNGDGRAGDRAFVFDPAVAPPGVAEGMRALLASAPAAARECLRGQLGSAAGRGSCRGPWTQHSNLRLSYRNPDSRGARLRDRASLHVTVENPLGGVDRLVHGPAGIRGWGGTSSPDPVLLRVTGFDAAAQEFRYSVNPRFGSTRAIDLAAPFRVTVQLGVQMGAPLARQQLQLYLRPGRGVAGERINAASLQRRYARNVPDVYDRILAMSDSLVLSGEQLQALRAAQAPYRAQMDSVWGGLAAYLAALPENYDVSEAVRRQEEATDRAWDINRGQGPAIRAILSPFQIQMADWIVIDALGGVRPSKPRLWRQ